MSEITAFLIYRPVMDYEESEESYLICATKERAEEVRAEMIAFALDLLSKVLPMHDEDGEYLADPEYDANERFNEALVDRATWPFGINLRVDIPWRSWRPRFDEGCIAISELPLV